MNLLLCPYCFCSNIQITYRAWICNCSNRPLLWAHCPSYLFSLSHSLNSAFKKQKAWENDNRFNHQSCLVFSLWSIILFDEGYPKLAWADNFLTCFDFKVNTMKIGNVVYKTQDLWNTRPTRYSSKYIPIHTAFSVSRGQTQC